MLARRHQHAQSVPPSMPWIFPAAGLTAWNTSWRVECTPSTFPEHQVGMSDHKNRVEWRTFFPDEMTGGGMPGGRINVDSGVMNLDLLARDYDERTSKLWAKSTLRKG